MKTKVLANIIVIIAICFLALPAHSADVPWSTEWYSAYATGVHYNTGTFYEDDSSGSTLPRRAQVGYYFLGEGADTNITSGKMDVFIDKHSFYDLLADARFSGNYTASYSSFLFDYTINNLYGGGAWLIVEDLSSSTTLYNGSLTNSDQLYINTPLGHDINVSFGIFAECTVGPVCMEDASLSYATAVVPEPISSILFIAGGSLLAGRRYLRRKKIA